MKNLKTTAIIIENAKLRKQVATFQANMALATAGMKRAEARCAGLRAERDAALATIGGLKVRLESIRDSLRIYF